MPGVTVTVLYPTGTQFDLNYYLTSHMPMVAGLLKPHGLTGWRVTQNVQPEAPYSIVCELYLDSLEGLEKGMAENHEKILDDVKNYSDKKAILMPGNVVGTG
jgi:uncharacterized protein (TIGR02118 family)